MQYPITHVLGGEKQDASLLGRKKEREIEVKDKFVFTLVETDRISVSNIFRVFI